MSEEERGRGAGAVSSEPDDPRTSLDSLMASLRPDIDGFRSGKPNPEYSRYTADTTMFTRDRASWAESFPDPALGT